MRYGMAPRKKGRADNAARTAGTAALRTMLKRPVGPADVVGSAAEVQAQGEDMGEFFQYVITTPVTAKQGSSALVPILDIKLSYERELLYNRAKLRDHPLIALRFSNSSGLNL